MGERDERYIACPYYLVVKQEHISNHIIRCEGVSEGNTISLVFATENKRKEHKHTYCYSVVGCKRCPIHHMLDSKYGVGSNE